MTDDESDPGKEGRITMCWLPIFDLQGESGIHEMIFQGLEMPGESHGSKDQGESG